MDRGTTIQQDRFGRFIRVRVDGTVQNLSSDEPIALPLRPIPSSDRMATRMAAFLDARR